MYNKLLNTVLSKEREYLKHVYFDKSARAYVATNGHIMLVEYTTDKESVVKYPENFTFPDWQKIGYSGNWSPLDGDFYLQDAPFGKGKKLAVINELAIDSRYYKKAIKFVGSGYRLELSDSGNVLRFTSVNTLRRAWVARVKV